MNRKCKQEIRKAGWMLGSALAIVFSAASLVRGQEGRVSPLGPIEDLALSAEEGAEGVAAEEGAAEAQKAAVEDAISQDANARISRSLWTKLDALPDALAADKGVVRPKKFQALSLDIHAMRDLLKTAPLESQIGDAKHSSFIVSLPMPDGKFARFRVMDSPVMEPGLAAKHPDIRTFAGQGVDEPSATIRFTVTSAGFHALILAGTGDISIDHLQHGDSAHYTSSFLKDQPRLSDWTCLSADKVRSAARGEGFQASSQSPVVNRRRYRLALATTYQVSALVSAPAAANDADVNSRLFVPYISDLNAIYERELSIHFDLVADNDLLIPTISPDPFNGNPTLDLAQLIIDNILGGEKYDIGHVIAGGTGLNSGSGVANSGVCVSGRKARGITNMGNPLPSWIRNFYVMTLAHEIGHQFSAQHTWNFCSGSEDQWVAGDAVEPGSGATIMSYSGRCGEGADYESNNPTALYFHARSLSSIQSYMTTGAGANCWTPLLTLRNNPPSVQAGPAKYIPSGTPFAMKSAGSDPDGDPISFCWEENDLGPAQPVSGPGSEDNGLSPLCRSWPPSQSSVRFLPMLTDLLANRTSAGERLPSVTRYPMRWRVTARDNRGGTSFADTALVVVGVPSPFRVLSPNTSVLLVGSQTVTWDTAGTQNWGQFATSAVNILLSIDGGRSFPYLLKQNTPNDGSEAVSMPVVLSDRVRIKVEAIDNVFFDVSNANCRIASPPATVSATKGTLCGKIRIKWSTVPGATSYRIHRSETSVFNPTVLISKAANATSHDDAPPETGRTYYYWVKPINANSLSAVSSIVNGWAAAPITAAPQRVTLTRDISTGNLVLAWAKVSGAASYEVFRSESPTPCSGTPLGTTSKLTFSNRPPLPLIRYYYSVRAKNGCGAGPCSQIVSGIR